MRLMIYNNIIHKSTAELDNENIGNLMTRAISDVDLCVEGMRKFTNEIFDTGVLMTVYLISMMFYNVKITLLAMIFIPIAMVLAEKLKHIIYKYSIAYRKKSSEVADITYDYIENSMLYRTNGLEAQNRDKYNVTLKDLQDKAIKANWKRIKPYLKEYESKDTLANIYENGTSLSVNNLNFYYVKGKGNILENVSFKGKQGEIIGVTGSIASGKSTLGVSLLGLYPYLGSIKIDGKELREYTEYERSQMITHLSHKPQLLSDTIYNNITMGSEQDISSVIKDVCFDVDFDAMPEGENTLVGNSGIRLSGGQQARIALARSLLHKSKIIILDDPFSAVDVKTEEKIIDNLRKNYKQCLIILISHRITVFNRINQIILLHNDKIADYGTHNELMKHSNIYATIYNLQSTESR